MITPALCEECGEAHCYWCGLPFVLDARDDENDPGRPSRDHRDAETDHAGTIRKGTVIVTAHAYCNSHRHHDPWVWHHADPRPIRLPDNQQHAIWSMEAYLAGRGGKIERIRRRGSPSLRQSMAPAPFTVSIGEASARPVRQRRERTTWANSRKRWLEKWSE